jgi:hypothetical protein
MDTAIIDAWERRHVREDDDAYEGRINLGSPNDVAAAYEREDQRAADEGDGRGGGGGCDDGPGQPKQGPGYRETRATVEEGGRRRMRRWSCRD